MKSTLNDLKIESEQIIRTDNLPMYDDSVNTNCPLGRVIGIFNNPMVSSKASPLLLYQAVLNLFLIMME